VGQRHCELHYANRLRTALSVASVSGPAWTQQYGYDSARRLTSVTSPAGMFDYNYDPVELQRVDSLTLPNNAYITNTFDTMARMTGTWLIGHGGSNLDSYVYGYNQASQRTNVVRTAGDTVTYIYDTMGQLKSVGAMDFIIYGGRPYEGRNYTYDAAGNMVNKKYSRNTYSQTKYGINSLNQITNATLGDVDPVSGWAYILDLSGHTTSLASNVTVYGYSGAYTAGLFGDNSFYNPESPTNGLNTYTAVANDVYGRYSTNVSQFTIIPTNNAYSYDLNGNLLTDGTRYFAYDDENELISVWQTNTWRNDFVYDGKLRRRIEKDFVWNSGSWKQTNEIHFVYDGNLVVQERDSNNVYQVNYTHGNDLSGKLQGAGGIGGLLARTDRAQYTPWIVTASGSIPSFGTHSYYHADGNGNVTALISASQMVVAKYLYDAFGNTLTQYGLLADVNKYRFSSKEWNGNSGLYYYLYRFYDPNLQRWLNHDPIGEKGFGTLARVFARDNYLNPYIFVRNDGVDNMDPLGLEQHFPPPFDGPPLKPAPPKPPGSWNKFCKAIIPASCVVCALGLLDTEATCAGWQGMGYKSFNSCLCDFVKSNYVLKKACGVCQPVPYAPDPIDFLGCDN